MPLWHICSAAFVSAGLIAGVAGEERTQGIGQIVDVPGLDIYLAVSIELVDQPFSRGEAERA